MARRRKQQLDPDARYFRFLARLRAGGRSNMYGAVPYLISAFGVDRDEAFRVVCRWIDLQQAARDEGRSQAPAALPQPVVVGRLKAPPVPPPPPRKRRSPARAKAAATGKRSRQRESQRPPAARSVPSAARSKPSRKAPARR